MGPEEKSEATPEYIKNIGEKITGLTAYLAFREDGKNEVAIKNLAQAISGGSLKPSDLNMTPPQIADLAEHKLSDGFDEQTLKILLSDKYLGSDGDLNKLRQQEKLSEGI